MARDRATFLYILDMPWPVAVLAALSACLFLALVGARIVYRPYHIPAGSMQPALEVGDYIFIDKFAYARGRPIARGDIVSFAPLTDEDAGQRYIKRVVGLPGDTVQVIDGVLHLNGNRVVRIALAPVEGDRHLAGGMRSGEPIPAVRETLPNGPSYTVLDRYDGPGDHTHRYDVPEGMLFMLGDDRDNSRDSRLEMGGFAFVPIDRVEGRLARKLARTSPLSMFLSFQSGYEPTESE